MAILWDADCRGFGIRTTASGARAFVLNYRVAGRQRQLTIGSFPDWSVSQAREEARTLKRRIDQGGDPLAERQQALAAPTIADLAKHYVEHHLPRKRPNSQAADDAYLENHVLPALGARKVASITHADIAALHRKITAPVLANRVVAMLSAIFNQAIRLEWITTNPAKGVERHQEHPRQRYLTGDEIQRLTAALDKRPGQSADAIRLLLLTGARKMEVLGATWDQFDLEAGVWTKPHRSVKQRRLHRVPLGQEALAILRRIRADADARVATAQQAGRILRLDPLVFASFMKPGQPRRFIDGFWSTICHEAGIEGCRLHDLRHSFASLLASSGQSLLVIGQMLGHTQPGTTARYSHLFDSALRDAADAVGEAVRKASAEPAKVVPIRR
jgi:integrase